LVDDSSVNDVGNDVIEDIGTDVIEDIGIDVDDSLVNDVKGDSLVKDNRQTVSSNFENFSLERQL
jgi:hypothetical protein